MIGLQTSLITLPFMIRSPKLQGEDHFQYMSSTLVHQMSFCGIFALLLSLTWWFLPLYHFHQEFIPVIKVLTITLTFILFKEFVRQLCFARLQIKKALAFDIAAGFLQLSGLFIFGLFGLLSPGNAFWIMGIACGSTSVYWLAANRRTLTFQPKQALRDFRDNWKQGRWILASGIAWSFGMNSYSWILAAFWGAGMVGVWSACMGVAALGNPLFMGMQNFLSPRISHFYARSGIQGLTRFIFGISAVFTASMLFFLLILVVFGDDFLKVFYGQKYSGNEEIIPALGTNLVIMSAGVASSRALFVMNRPDVDCAVNLISLFVLAATGFFLVKHFGLMGAAFALIISSITSSSLLCFSFALLARRTTRGVSDGKWYSSPQR